MFYNNFLLGIILRRKKRGEGKHTDIANKKNSKYIMVLVANVCHNVLLFTIIWCQVIERMVGRQVFYMLYIKHDWCSMNKHISHRYQVIQSPRVIKIKCYTFFIMIFHMQQQNMMFWHNFHDIYISMDIQKYNQ